MNSTEIIYDEYTYHTIDLFRYDAHIRTRIRGLFKNLQADITAQINEIYFDGFAKTSTKLAKLEEMQKAIDLAIKQTYRKARDSVFADLAGLAESENQFIYNAFGNALGIELKTVGFSPTVLRELSRNTLIEGATLKEWWGTQAQKFRNNFQREMRMGIMANETNSDLIRRIRGRSTGKRVSYYTEKGDLRYATEFKGGIADLSTREAEALVRTSVQNVAQAARIENFKNNELVKGWAASVTFDIRTSDLCMSRSGNAWNKDGSPMKGTHTTIRFPGHSPWHFNCRTQILPVLKSWKELATKNKKFLKHESRLKVSMDGNVPADQTYDKWLKTKSKSEQIDALGKTRQELFQQGKLKSKDLVDQTGRSLTLEQLKDKGISLKKKKSK
jgi:hypothetical protein